MDTADTPRDSARVTVADVTTFLRRAGLDPQHWDVKAIVGKANRWVADNLLELAQMGQQWSTEDQAAHLAEFGAVSAVDFVEQCVIEAGPDTAPWDDLQRRADAGEFDEWEPIWRHTSHAEEHSHALTSERASHARPGMRCAGGDALRDDRIGRAYRAYQRLNTVQRGCVTRDSVNSVEI